MNKMPARTNYDWLSIYPVLTPNIKKAPAIPSLPKKPFKASRQKFTSAKWAGRNLAAGEGTNEKCYLPLLRICRENMKVCAKHKNDPSWNQCIQISQQNLKLMESKWKDSVRATNSIRKTLRLQPRTWPK